ncbi:aa3-type cytochrome c oxidase subunit IV [Nitrobacter hamburgensis]|uniref:aa3-type cytochrome c oxidase subunit IV n=1 Tax=Nitrobacter hamburgensis TaxID=912 RepID=UPI0009D7621B|nr:aa3-type cytochrome c oxidase subunit IV [Nitrobacter hamburgensis]
MSDHSEILYSTAEGMDYPAHEQQYKTFLKIGILGTATAATVIVLLAIFLT